LALFTFHLPGHRNKSDASARPGVQLPRLYDELAEAVFVQRFG